MNLSAKLKKTQREPEELLKSDILFSESDSKYRMLAENSFDIIATHNSDGTFIYVSPACEKILGYRQIELIGRKPSEFVHPNDLRDFITLKKERLSDRNKIMTGQYRMLKKDGTYCWLESSSNIITESSEYHSPFLISITRDITERKMSESVKMRLAKILDNTLTEVYFLDAGTLKFIQVNRAAMDKTGYTTDELLNIDPFNIDPLLGRKEFERIIIPLKNGEKKEILFEGTHKKKDGQKYPVETRVQYSAEEDPPIFLLISQDITQRKTAESEVRLLHKSVEELNDIVLITESEPVDEPGPKIIFVNNAVETITGYSKKEVLGKSPRIFQGKNTSRHTLDRIRKALLEQISIKEEILNYRKNGEEYWIELSISPMKNPGGDCAYFVAVERDITERKNNHRELIQAKEKAEEMNRLKSNFLANMSHELRTPMIGILGYAELLFQELKDPDHKEMTDFILESGRRLLETLNLLLDLSRIESGKLEINYNKVNLVELVRDSCKIFEIAAAAKSLSIELFLPEEEIEVVLDERLYREILNNLVNNAIKYTENGGVKIYLDKVTQGCGEALLLTVKDTGIGIRDDQLEIIFEEFRQSSEGFDRSFEGTGLGLTLARKFVEILGGEISVFSEYGVGSIFTVKIPLE